jgi:multiple sugar transport system substrate-binding protein
MFVAHRDFAAQRTAMRGFVGRLGMLFAGFAAAPAAGFGGADDAAPLAVRALDEAGSPAFEVLEEAMAGSGIPVDVTGDRLKLQYVVRSIIARQAGDVIELREGEIADLARRGALLPLTAHVVDLRPPRDTFAWAHGRGQDGEQYAVPWALRPEMLLWNRTWFRRRARDLRAAGLAPRPPRTWDEMLRAAAALTVDTDGDGRLDEFGFALAAKRGPEFGRYHALFVAQLGGKLVEWSEGRWVFDADLNRGRRALRLIRDLHLLAPPECIVSSPSMALKQFHNGRAAMVFAGPEGLNPPPGAPVQRGDIGVAVLPAPAGLASRSCIEMRYLAIPACVRGHRRGAAIRLVRYMSEQPAQQTIASGTDGAAPLLPARAAELHAAGLHLAPELRPFVDGLDYPVPPLPAFVWEGKCAKDWIRELHLPLIVDYRPIDEAVERSYARGNVAISCLISDIGHPSATMTLGMVLVGAVVFVAVAYAVSRR